jgi:hypothetical protein
MVDMQGRAEAAFPAVLIQMREHGMRLPAEALLNREHPSGMVLLRDHFTRPRWHAHLCPPDNLDRDLVPQLSDAVLVREGKGVRLYRGTQWVNGVHVVQSWLCAPTAARAKEILLAMDWKAQG